MGVSRLRAGRHGPWLRRPSQSPRLWGFVAFGASLILFLSAGLTSTGEVSLPLIAAGLVFALVGALLQRGGAIERYWPILALSVAINILGLTRVSANFFDIQREAYFLNRSPLLTLRPGPGTRFGGLTSERWSSMLGGLGTWRPLPPPAFSWSAWLAPPAVAQARTAMKAHADEMRAVQATMAERAEAMHRSLGAFETSITAAARARLTEQEQRLSVLETDGGRLLTTMDELGRQLTRSLAGSLTRPIRAESVVVDDITDQWKQALKKEQSDFTRSRQDFERKLADHAAALDKARASLTRSLAAVAHAREQLAEQVAAAKLLELAMAAPSDSGPRSARSRPGPSATPPNERPRTTELATRRRRSSEAWATMGRGARLAPPDVKVGIGGAAVAPPNVNTNDRR